MRHLRRKLAYYVKAANSLETLNALQALLPEYGCNNSSSEYIQTIAKRKLGKLTSIRILIFPY